MIAVRWSWGSLAAVVATIGFAGCSSSDQGTPPSSSTATSLEAGAPTAEAGISPGGVTTSLSVPSGITEDEYFQACHAAKSWMVQRPGDLHTRIEPYLAMVQASPAGEDGTWNTPWGQLSPQRQAGVILAATSAADDMCG